MWRSKSISRTKANKETLKRELPFHMDVSGVLFLGPGTSGLL